MRLPKVEVTIKEIDYSFALDDCLLQFLGIATAQYGLACVERFNGNDFSDFCHPERSKTSNLCELLQNTVNILPRNLLFFLC